MGCHCMKCRDEVSNRCMSGNPRSRPPSLHPLALLGLCCPPLLLLWDSSSHPCPSGKGPSSAFQAQGVISQGMMLKLYTSNTRESFVLKTGQLGRVFSRGLWLGRGGTTAFLQSSLEWVTALLPEDRACVPLSCHCEGISEHFRSCFPLL